MKTTTFKHENVLPDGTFSNRSGSVCIKGRMTMSVNKPYGGCGLPHCNCSPGHWISIVKPRTKNGIVEGKILKFDNKKEMDEYLIKHNIQRINK